MNHETHLELWGYELVSANVKTSERDAKALQELVSRNPRFDHRRKTGCIRCGCKKQRRCKGDECPNRRNDFECDQCNKDCHNNELIRLSQSDTFSPVTIRNNPGYGLCLFATRTIQPGEIFGECIGAYVTHPAGQSNPRSFHSIRIVTEESQPDDRVFALDMSKQANEFRFASHDCNPNSETFLVKVGSEVRVGVLARRLIQRNEIVTFNYGLDYFSNGLTCHCDTCREGGGLAATRQRGRARSVSRGRTMANKSRITSSRTPSRNSIIRHRDLQGKKSPVRKSQSVRRSQSQGRVPKRITRSVSRRRVTQGASRITTRSVSRVTTRRNGSHTTTTTTTQSVTQNSSRMTTRSVSKRHGQRQTTRQSRGQGRRGRRGRGNQTQGHARQSGTAEQGRRRRNSRRCSNQSQRRRRGKR